MPGNVVAVHRVGYGVPFARWLRPRPEPGLSARPSRPFRNYFAPHNRLTFSQLREAFQEWVLS